MTSTVDRTREHQLDGNDVRGRVALVTGGTMGPSRKGTVTVELDEHVRPGVTLEDLATLRPAFADTRCAQAHGLQPMGRRVAYAHAGVQLRIMGMGPVPAVRAVLERADLKIEDIDIFEVNEAFAAQALAVVRELGLPAERTNPNGGGVSLGHPIGATGAILTVKALYELRRTGGRHALVTMCIRGGQGIAAVFERL